MNARYRRWLAAALAAVVLAAGASWLYLYRRQPAPLVSISQAYSMLGEGLATAGLVPFPSDRAGLEAVLGNAGTPEVPLSRSTDSLGQPVYQLGAALTVMTEAGSPVRYLLLLEHWQDFAGTALGEALRRLEELPLSVQRPLKVANSDGQPVYAQSFYFEYSTAGQTWRFTPQFEGERCVRVDVQAAQ